jgi:hypothetical protein
VTSRCYRPGNTSYVHDQAYREIREDGHPVVILAGADLVELVKQRGLDTASRLSAYRVRHHPAGDVS